MPEAKKQIRCTACNKVIAENDYINDARLFIKCKCGVTNTIEAKPKQAETSGVITNGHNNGLVLGTFSIQNISDTSERQDRP